jgi:hypothetical protein
VTPNAQTEYIVGDGQTLVPGGPGITVSGTPVSLAPGATRVVVGGSTAGLGSVILSGLRGGGGSAATATTAGSEAPVYTGAVYTGGAGRGRAGEHWNVNRGVVGSLALIMGWAWWQILLVL